jgi:hypothetical protein
MDAQEATPIPDGATLVLVEHNERTESIDQGQPGVSAGDILVWGPNPFYDAADESPTDVSVSGTCITLTTDGDQHCTETLVFADGSMLTAQGTQRPGSPSSFVVTGGTGRYLGATGTVGFEPSEDLTSFTYTIEFGE